MKRISVALLIMLTTLPLFALQNDTIFVQNTSELPVIDGNANDNCWNNAQWQGIDQVWIPLNTSIDSTDFYGRFKLLWSSETNLLYILGETVDDTWVDGFVENQTDPGVHEYDIFEVFIDEDRSGGLHIFDYFDDSGNPINTNSENAFSYHMAINAPVDGESTSDLLVMDLDGKNWYPDIIRPNYASHFNSFTASRNGNKMTWEMSLIVYDSSYNTNPSTARVNLYNGKISGFAIAYCDDDTPSNIQRQSFIGSVKANLDYLDGDGNFNDTWRNADHFGVIKFVNSTGSSSGTYIHMDGDLIIDAYPNPTDNYITLKISSATEQNISYTIYNASGLKIAQKNVDNGYGEDIKISLNEYPDGLYLIALQQGEHFELIKTIKTQ